MIITCNRCGACCIPVTPDGIKRKCRFLISLANGKTLCRIYRNRIGTIVFKDDKGIAICGYREELDKNFPNCPFNRSEWVQMYRSRSIS